MKTETKVIKGRQGIARNRHTPLCLGLLLALSPLAAAVATRARTARRNCRTW